MCWKELNVRANFRRATRRTIPWGCRRLLNHCQISTKLTAHFIDVRAGDAIPIETPTHSAKHIVIDGDGCARC